MQQISIIIPCYNEAQNIKKLVPHLLAHGEGQCEIIIVDGGSTDKTLTVAQNLGVKSILSPEKGRAAQMNCGAKLAIGDILFFLHADTIPPPSFVRSILDGIACGKEMGCFPYYFDSPKRVLKFNAFMTQFDLLFCRGGDQGLYISKINFEALKGFDLNYVIMEDYEFLIRARKSYSFTILDERAIVSARKYIKNSYLKVNFANLIAFTLFRFGSSPKHIARIYKSLLNCR